MTKTEMTSRERVLTAASRKTPDRVPRDIPLEKYMINLMMTHYGTQDLRLLTLFSPGSTRIIPAIIPVQV
jgi:hypothetical protein